MNIFQYIFTILYIWVLVYTGSMFISNIRSRHLLAAANSLICTLLSLALFLLYVLI